MTKKIVLTGTHLTPALALIDKLKQEKWQITYLGRQTSFAGSHQPAIEKQLLPTKKIKFISITSPKLQRHNLPASLFHLFRFPLGLTQSLYHLKKLQPAIVISFGGYVAVPVCLAAKFLKIPLIIHEQTLAAGLTSKLTARLADKIALSWSVSTKYFPANKTILTGNPLRQALLNLKPLASPSQPPAIYITGGNQGSQIINHTLNQIILKLLQQYTLYHQFGLAQSESDWQKQQNLRRSLPSDLKKRYFLKRWFTTQDLASLLPRTKLVICRSGINTITELAYLKKPALLIPLPHTQKHEQQLNAQFLNSLGLALILPQSQLSVDSLLKAINQALKQLPRQSSQNFPQDLVKQATNNLYQAITQLLSDRQKN